MFPPHKDCAVRGSGLWHSATSESAQLNNDTTTAAQCSQ